MVILLKETIVVSSPHLTPPVQPVLALRDVPFGQGKALWGARGRRWRLRVVWRPAGECMGHCGHGWKKRGGQEKKRRKLQVLQILLGVQPLRHWELLLEIADVAIFQSCCNGLEVSSARL